MDRELAQAIKLFGSRGALAIRSRSGHMPTSSQAPAARRPDLQTSRLVLPPNTLVGRCPAPERSEADARSAMQTWALVPAAMRLAVGGLASRPHRSRMLPGCRLGNRRCTDAPSGERPAGRGIRSLPPLPLGGRRRLHMPDVFLPLLGIILALCAYGLLWQWRGGGP